MDSSEFFSYSMGMGFSYSQVSLPGDQDRLIAFLSGEDWPFHLNHRLTREKVTGMIAEGIFNGSNYRSFWILDELNSEVGLIRLTDLEDVDDGYPLFDLRIRCSHRGRGAGKAALKWLTDYLFQTYPQLDRIMGSTRADNIPMRKTFLACGYVKEGHLRRDWADSSGQLRDSTKYGVIREDWESKTVTQVHWNDEDF
jgi:RimJ/RimL family protein N-acetyltransferase